MNITVCVCVCVCVCVRARAHLHVAMCGCVCACIHISKCMHSYLALLLAGPSINKQFSIESLNFFNIHLEQVKTMNTPTFCLNASRNLKAEIYYQGS